MHRRNEALRLADELRSFRLIPKLILVPRALSATGTDFLNLKRLDSERRLVVKLVRRFVRAIGIGELSHVASSDSRHLAHNLHRTCTCIMDCDERAFANSGLDVGIV